MDDTASWPDTALSRGKSHADVVHGPLTYVPAEFETSSSSCEVVGDASKSSMNDETDVQGVVLSTTDCDAVVLGDPLSCPRAREEILSAKSDVHGEVLKQSVADDASLAETALSMNASDAVVVHGPSTYVPAEGETSSSSCDAVGNASKPSMNGETNVQVVLSTTDCDAVVFGDSSTCVLARGEMSSDTNNALSAVLKISLNDTASLAGTALSTDKSQAFVVHGPSAYVPAEEEASSSSIDVVDDVSKSSMNDETSVHKVGMSTTHCDAVVLGDPLSCARVREEMLSAKSDVHGEVLKPSVADDASLAETALSTNSSDAIVTHELSIYVPAEGETSSSSIDVFSDVSSLPVNDTTFIQMEFDAVVMQDQSMCVPAEKEISSAINGLLSEDSRASVTGEVYLTDVSLTTHESDGEVGLKQSICTDEEMSSARSEVFSEASKLLIKDSTMESDPVAVHDPLICVPANPETLLKNSHVLSGCLISTANNSNCIPITASSGNESHSHVVHHASTCPPCDGDLSSATKSSICGSSDPSNSDQASAHDLDVGTKCVDPAAASEVPNCNLAGKDSEQDTKAVDQNWHRLAELSRSYFPLALKPFLEEVMQFDGNYSKSKTFDENLNDVLSPRKSSLSKSLSHFEKEEVFPASGKVGQFSGFDVIIVAQLINHLLSVHFPTSQKICDFINSELIKVMNRPGSRWPIGVDFEKDFRAALKANEKALQEHWKFKSKKETMFRDGGIGSYATFDCLLVYKLTTFFLPLPRITVGSGNETKPNPVLESFDFDSANRYHAMMFLYEFRNMLSHKRKKISDTDFEVYWRCLTKCFEILGFDTERILPVKTMIIDISTARKHDQWASKARKDDAREELRQMYNERHNALELDEVGEPNDAGIKRGNIRVSLVTVERGKANHGCHDTMTESLYGTERSLSSTKQFEISSLLENNISTALIDGAPGIGKSTLCDTICSDWLDGKIWKDKFDLVFYVNCGELRSYADETASKEQALNVAAHPKSSERAKGPLEKMYSPVFKGMSLEEMLNQGLKCAVIIDGIDEINIDAICTDEATSLRSVDRFVQYIIKLAGLRKIIVGRPYACYQVQQSFFLNKEFQRVEVIGFNEDQAKEFVLRFFNERPEKGEDIWSKMQENTMLLSMMKVPIFASILCFLFKDDQSFHMPTTQTELYVWNYIGLMYRHCKEKPNLKTLPRSKLFNDAEILNDLRALCKMAYDNLLLGNVYFKAPTKVSNTFLKYFMRKREELVAFSHHTQMEFFAAIELLLCGKLPLDKLMHHSWLDERFEVMLTMYSGLRGATLKDSNSPDIIQEFIQPLLRKFGVENVSQHSTEDRELAQSLSEMNKDLFLAMCYEYRNEKASENMYADAGLLDLRRISIHYHNQLKHFLYFVKNFVPDNVEMEFLAFELIDESLTDCECNDLVEAIRGHENPNHLRVGIKTLNLCNCGLNDAKMETLSSALVQARSIDLSHNEMISQIGWTKFANLVRSGSESGSLKLDHIILSGCTSEMVVHMSLAFPCISEVDLSFSEGVSAEAWKSLCARTLEGKCKIQSLNLTRCDLGDDSMKCLVEMLPFIEEVYLGGNQNLSSIAWGEFAKAILKEKGQNSMRIKRLNLSACNLYDNSMECLVEMLPFIEDVDLGLNQNISSNAWEEFAKAISKEKDQNSMKMKRLKLCGCDLNDASMESLLNVLPFIQKVDLMMNKRITAPVWEKLAIRIADCASSVVGLDMNELDLTCCKLDNDSITKSSVAIPHLVEVKLDGNKISDEALGEIASSVERTDKRRLVRLSITCENLQYENHARRMKECGVCMTVGPEFIVDLLDLLMNERCSLHSQLEKIKQRLKEMKIM